MPNKKIDLSRRQILGSVGTIGAASAAAGLGTQAFLSDEETFQDNTIAAGSLDLVVDWEEHYSDWSQDEAEGLENGIRMEEPDEDNFVGLPDPENPLIWVHQDDLARFMENTALEAFPDANDDGSQDSLEEFDACTDLADVPEDLDPAESLRTESSDTVDAAGNVQPLVSLQDVMPGDFGELTLSFHLCDNDGFVWLQGGLVDALENGVTDSEAEDPDEGDGVELLDQLQTLLWYDEDNDNILDRGEEAIFRGSMRELLKLMAEDNGIPLDGNLDTEFDELEGEPSAEGRECFANSTTNAIGLAWWLPTDAGNEIETDSVSFDFGFYTEQCRHNDGSGQARFRRAQGTVLQRTTGDVPEPPEPSGDPDSPIEGYPVSEEVFEEWKARASNGELPQPPAENIQAEEVISPANASLLGTQQARQITLNRSFDGWESTEVRSDPPDSNIAVGPNHAVLAVNRRWGIYDKSSGNRSFQVQLEDWFAPVIDENENFVFDPKALYDHDAGRFILMAVARNSTDQEGSWVVAVSDDSNPFGTWWLTRIPDHAGDSNWVDYPGLGVDQNGIYLTANVFNFSNNFQFSKLVTIDKTPLYNGNSFTYWWFNDLRNPDGSRAFTVQPTHGITPAGSQYLVNSRWNSGNKLTLWKLTNPTSRPRLSRQNVNVRSYSLPPNAEQPTTSDTLDTVDARLMNAVYENGSVWTTHSISYDWNNDGDASALLKWYEIDVNSGSIAQSRGWGRPNADYYFPAIASDGETSTMIVYNESDDEQVFPRIEVAGRTKGHTQNSLEDVVLVKPGESVYSRTKGTDRWGDYAGIVVDPSFRSYWSFSQYAIDPDTTSEWETWVGEVGFQDIIG